MGPILSKLTMNYLSNKLFNEPMNRYPTSFRNYRSIKNDPLDFFSRVQKECGDFTRIDLFPFRYYLVNDPELVREALVEKPNTFIIKGGVSTGLARLIGHGILTNRGEQWKESRRGLQPLFNHEVLKTYSLVMPLRTQESLDRWKSEFTGKYFSLGRELLALSCRITCSSLFNYLPSFDEALEFADAIQIVQSDGMDRFMHGLDLADWIPIALNRRVNRARKNLHQLAQRCITSGCSYSADEILSILFAGTESPANTLCWALKLLEDNPAWRERISGIDSEMAISQVLSETMRLYPAGWAFERSACEDTTLGGELVGRGSRLLFSPFLMHRNPRFWAEPEMFKPERFVDGEIFPTGVHKYAYIPFGVGPRSCIGSRMAWVEMSMVLEMIMKQCRWEIQKDSISPKGSFKIRLSRPMMVKMEF